MTAKIKSHPKHIAYSGHRHKPRGITDKAFEQVYWPFIPVLIAISLLLTATAHTGSLAAILSRPHHHVLAYATSEDPTKALGWTNIEREQSGEPHLAINSELAAAAQAKANDMATRDYWSHNTPEGNPPWVFVTTTGYAYDKLGENLATGFNDEESAVKAWMASPPHRENLLDPAYTQVGFGFANITDYKAVGGGPMTIIVAFYGEPSGAVPTSASHPISTGLAPSTANFSDNRTLASQTSRSVLAFDSHQAAYWSPIVAIVGFVAIIAALAGKHTRQIRRFVKSSERFIWHHPIFDLSLLVAAGILLALAQTAGFIQ